MSLFAKRTPRTLFVLGVTAGLIPVGATALILLVYKAFAPSSRSCEVGLGGCVIDPAIGVGLLAFIVASVCAIIYSVISLRKLGLSSKHSILLTIIGPCLAIAALAYTLKWFNEPFASVPLAYIVLGMSYWSMGKPVK